MQKEIKKIGIIGGGLAGLASSFLLSTYGYEVVLFEKKSYPFHRVCGEYLSAEVFSFLNRNALLPQVDLPHISKFMLTSISGAECVRPLQMGGIGISRYLFDQYMYTRAVDVGVDVRLNTTVRSVTKQGAGFIIDYDKGVEEFDLAIGAFGKRSLLDKSLARGHMKRKAPYIGVKYHIKTDFPDDTVALHNFAGGYCGICRIEEGKYNLCYLGTKEGLRKYGNIKDYEHNVLFRNPYLKTIFTNSDFLLEKPVVINEISFAPKVPVYNNILMVGDAAGLITPLNGNGMAMAIRAGKMAADIICQCSNSPRLVQKCYGQSWTKEFSNRLLLGRLMQKLFGATITSELAVTLLSSSEKVSNLIIQQSHGEELS